MQREGRVYRSDQFASTNTVHHSYRIRQIQAVSLCKVSDRVSTLPSRNQLRASGKGGFSHSVWGQEVPRVLVWTTVYSYYRSSTITKDPTSATPTPLQLSSSAGPLFFQPTCMIFRFVALRKTCVLMLYLDFQYKTGQANGKTV